MRVGYRKGWVAREVYRRGLRGEPLLFPVFSFSSHGHHPLPNLPDLARPQPCQRSLSVLSPRQPAQNRGTAYSHPLLGSGQPKPTQPLTALLSLLESTPLASGPSSFQRAGSVRDRVHKFTSDSPMAARLQDGTPRAALGPLTPERLLGPSLTSTTPASSSSGSSSRGPSDTSSQLSKERRGVAQPPAQLRSCPQEEGPRGRGLAASPLENRAGGPVARSEEPGAPLPVAVGTAEPGGSMKTTFTIEIKDGRGQASTGNQRAELTLGLRAPPTLLSTSSGGKSTITRVNSPGTLTRLGNVTHVTSFSHASPGSRGGYSIKSVAGYEHHGQARGHLSQAKTLFAADHSKSCLPVPPFPQSVPAVENSMA
ncbi:hypothetical protein P7K49_002783 [Saguinus oedipus]|uniref:Uncharacterized protein n=1 Tax=Saguinus oedipus TaxID=9490 RepID=A0ABQ9WIB1_SAGOE|nr:hypothetical protein P7K49_002783 [Saguinus oedipus]